MVHIIYPVLANSHIGFGSLSVCLVNIAAISFGGNSGRGHTGIVQSDHFPAFKGTWRSQASLILGLR